MFGKKLIIVLFFSNNHFERGSSFAYYFFSNNHLESGSSLASRTDDGQRKVLIEFLKFDQPEKLELVCKQSQDV